MSTSRPSSLLYDASYPINPDKEELVTERRMINPWQWQDEFGYVQANQASGVQRILDCSGQATNNRKTAGPNVLFEPAVSVFKGRCTAS
jgi:hypothetical protein